MRRAGVHTVRLALAVTLLFALVPAGVAQAHEVGGHDFWINRTLTEGTGELAGDTLVLNGAGFFNSRSGRTDGSGTFTHKDADGTVVARGTWVVIGVVSFETYGEVPPLEGGLAVLEAKFFPTQSPNFTVSDFTIDCLVGSPPPDAEEGVRIPSLGFTESIEGPHRFTVFARI